MSCFCDCSRENIKPNNILPISQSTASERRLSSLGVNYDIYMSKKVVHGLPTIKENYEEEDEIKPSRLSKMGTEIRKKNPILSDIINKKQFYEFKEQLLYNNF